MEGNIFALPFLGMEVMLQVAEISGGAVGQVFEVTAESKVTIQDRNASSSSAPASDGPSYARRAAQAAAAAFEEEDGGPAAEAAFQAATAGIRSLGSPLSSLGGLQSQVRNCANPKGVYTKTHSPLPHRWIPCGSRSSPLY